MASVLLATWVWLVLSILGMLVSLRAVWRGSRRYLRSTDNVSRAVHVAELATGLLFFFVFATSISTVVTSVVILPPAEPVPDESAYQDFRNTVIRWQLIAEKAMQLVIVFIPELLDRTLVRMALQRELRKDDEGV